MPEIKPCFGKTYKSFVKNKIRMIAVGFSLRYIYPGSSVLS
ncbi:hypothetical protein NSE_0451 [Neorickettsia sennetsu str. Miyayama]|uniref:Uncharacterized protein n=1 Tax=Ehrlichia sennetsu (strain ATCC VR-367 / Miyayama) TaxID=222891 RepID=Q2GDW0_EHRS3|nr:hypothetical protein NSE_0451 [Neorickettsia sennetsu str. Miyayama]